MLSRSQYQNNTNHIENQGRLYREDRVHLAFKMRSSLLPCRGTFGGIRLEDFGLSNFSPSPLPGTFIDAVDDSPGANPRVSSSGGKCLAFTVGCSKLVNFTLRNINNLRKRGHLKARRLRKINALAVRVVLRACDCFNLARSSWPSCLSGAGRGGDWPEAKIGGNL